MIVIERPRNSGKTTILLHFMVVNGLSLYVARTEDCARQAFRLSRDLGLNLQKSRFVGMTHVDLKDHHGWGEKILVDDADYIIERHPELGYDLIAIAYAITINGKGG